MFRELRECRVRTLREFRELHVMAGFIVGLPMFFAAYFICALWSISRCNSRPTAIRLRNSFFLPSYLLIEILCYFFFRHFLLFHSYSLE